VLIARETWHTPTVCEGPNDRATRPPQPETGQIADVREGTPPFRRVAAARPSPAMMPTASGRFPRDPLRIVDGTAGRETDGFPGGTATASACGASWLSFVSSQARCRSVSAPHARAVLSNS
jgi:hypothetical protein